MPSNRWDESKIRCEFRWQLARWHAWANWIPGDELVRAVPPHECGRAHEVAHDLKQDPFTIHRPGRGFKLDHSRIEAFAELLRDECGYDEFRIEATLSHFHGFGGEG